MHASSVVGQHRRYLHLLVRGALGHLSHPRDAYVAPGHRDQSRPDDERVQVNKRRTGLATGLVAFALIVAGTAVIYRPAALIVAGFLLVIDRLT